MVFWVIMAVAIGNLLLGFALAVFLHRQYQILQRMSSPTGPSSETGLFPPDELPKKAGGIRREEIDPVSGTGMVPEWHSVAASVVSAPLLEESSSMGSGEEAGGVSGVSSEMTDSTGSSSSPPEESTSGWSGEEVPEGADGEVLAESSRAMETLSESSPAKRPSGEESLEGSGESQPRPADSAETAPASAELSGASSEEGDVESPQSQGSAEPSGPEEGESAALRGSVQAEEEPPAVAETQSPDSGAVQRGDFSRSSAFQLKPGELSSWEGVREGESGRGESGPNEKSSESERPWGEAVAGRERSSSPGIGPPFRPSEEKAPADRAASSQSSAASRGLEASLERALEQWQQEAARYFEQLSRTRSKVQHLSKDPKTEEIQASWSEIHRAGQDYLTTARPAREAFGQLANLRPAIRPIHDHLNTLAAKEEALIEWTQDLAPQRVQAGEDRFLCQQLLQHTDRLLAAHQKVQAVLKDAVHGGSEPASSPEADASHRSGRGSILDETAREKISTWWDHSRSRLHRLSILLLGVDEWEQLEETYGTLLCEGLLQALEKLLQADCGPEDILIRLSGQRFACFFANQPLQQAVDRAESLRQRLIATRFYRRRTQLRISVSCGVTEATREDTPETVLERAEVALWQARRYGKGRTFLHDGYFPMPVPPHPLSISPKELEI